MYLDELKEKLVGKTLSSKTLDNPIIVDVELGGKNSIALIVKKEI